jgi:radical SAM superfamily enzyme YgiQ (UPF0313 family)
LISKHAVKRVFVLDPTFNMHEQRALDILGMLQRHSHPDTMYTFEVRAELLTKALVEAFSAINCSLQIGLQSSNDRVLATAGRSFDRNAFERGIKLLGQYDIVFGLDLIIGLPQDTLASFKASLDYALGCKPSNIDIFLLAVLPGTQLATESRQHGLVHQTSNPYLLQHSPTISERDIEAALRLKHACDRFHAQGQAAFWFDAVVNGTGSKRIEFLELFAQYLDEHDPDDTQDILTLQDGFVSHVCAANARQEALPALLSYMELHQGFSYLMETGDEPVVELRYDPEALAKLDDMDAMEFVCRYKPFKRPKQYMVHRGEQGIDVTAIQGTW